jgi:hypothetical protein
VPWKVGEWPGIVGDQSVSRERGSCLQVRRVQRAWYNQAAIVEAETIFKREDGTWAPGAIALQLRTAQQMKEEE